jgi:hypothetical protein
MYKVSVTGLFAFAVVVSIAMLAACSATVSGTPGEGVGSTAAEVSCEPITTCYNAGFTCGTGSNGCGGTLSCGNCPSGQVCNNNNCYPANCKPMTCAQVGANCNETGDGCGGIIDCGTCPAGEVCNSIVCIPACTPNTETCAQRGYTCGDISDGCGGPEESCGTCTTGHVCCAGTCQSGTKCHRY